MVKELRITTPISIHDTPPPSVRLTDPNTPTLAVVYNVLTHMVGYFWRRVFSMRSCSSRKRCKSLIILDFDINVTKTIGLRIVDDLAFLHVGNGNDRVKH